MNHSPPFLKEKYNAQAKGAALNRTVLTFNVPFGKTANLSHLKEFRKSPSPDRKLAAKQ